MTDVISAGTWIRRHAVPFHRSMSAAAPFDSTETVPTLREMAASRHPRVAAHVVEPFDFGGGIDFHETEVEQVDAPRMLQLRVKAWPTGEGRVVLTCTPTGDGKTEVVMEERAVSGPATVMPKAAQDLMLHPRNVEALRRLAYLAEHHARSHG